MFSSFGPLAQKDCFIIYHEADSPLEQQVWTTLNVPKSQDSLSNFLFPKGYDATIYCLIEDSLYFGALYEIEKVFKASYNALSDSTGSWGCTSFITFDIEGNIRSKYTLPDQEATEKFMNNLLMKHEGGYLKSTFEGLFNLYLMQIKDNSPHKKD